MGPSVQIIVLTRGDYSVACGTILIDGAGPAITGGNASGTDAGTPEDVAKVRESYTGSISDPF
jgi:hypothetical protein